jgi:Response regulator receiver domain
VVLLDVMMPGMDGFEVCRRLKADPRTQHIPVIIITALDQPSDRVKGLEAGADDFLTKPVDDIALITRVKNLARLKMLTDEMLMRASTEEQMGFAATVGLGLDQLGLRAAGVRRARTAQYPRHRSAARSSSWSCLIPTWPRPIWSASGCANVSQPHRSTPGSASGLSKSPPVWGSRPWNFPTIRVSSF